MKTRRLTFALVMGVFALAFTFCFLTGCGTVTQAPVASKAPSFDPDSGKQNSGILAKTTDGYIVTPHFRDRYNALISAYADAKYANGAKVFPFGLKADDGAEVVDGYLSSQIYQLPQVWHFSNYAMENMVVLSRLEKRAFKQK